MKFVIQCHYVLPLDIKNQPSLFHCFSVSLGQLISKDTHHSVTNMLIRADDLKDFENKGMYDVDHIAKISECEVGPFPRLPVHDGAQ